MLRLSHFGGLGTLLAHIKLNRLYPASISKDANFAAARRSFLQTISSLVPAVLESLRSDVWRPHQSLVENPELKRLTIRAYPQFFAAVTSWAQDYHLCVGGAPADWIIDAALLTMRTEPALERGIWNASCFGYSYWPELTEDQMIVVPSISWDPFSGESEESVRRRKKQQDRQFEERLRKVREFAVAHGTPARVKTQDEHFIWAVQFQVLEQDVSDFEGCSRRDDPSGLNRRRVHAGIKSVLALVGLTRREARRGRKRRLRKSSSEK